MKLLVALLLIISVIAVGCLQQPPEIINDSGALNASATATNASAFITAGCTEKGNGELNCSAIGLEKRFSCENIRVPDGLGGLSPGVPIVECTVLARNWTGGTDAGIVREGCMLPLFRKYIVIEDGGYMLIGSKAEFVRFFAPVGSPEEALGFAVALTNSHPAYNLTIPQGYNVYVSKIRTTYVEKTDDGFDVRLFLQQFCGCGSFPYYAIDYHVTLAGGVNETASERVCEDPKLAGMCID
jgi:hypothetical protein